MKKIITIMILVLVSVLLTSCFPTATQPGAQDNTNNDATQEVVIENNPDDTTEEAPEEELYPEQPVGVELTAEEAKLAFSLTEVNYLGRGKENYRGDRSSVQHLSGTKFFKARTQLVYKFIPYGVPDGLTYVKILSRGETGEENSVRFESALERGSQKSMVMDLILKNPGEESRLKYCFGGKPNFDPLAPNAVCLSKIIEGPQHNIEVNVKELRLRFDTQDAIALDEIKASRGVIIKNQGNVATTFFIYMPTTTEITREKHTIEPEVDYVYLRPQEEIEVNFNAYLTYEGGDIHGLANGGFYAIPEDCKKKAECYASARYQNDMSIELYE